MKLYMSAFRRRRRCIRSDIEPFQNQNQLNQLNLQIYMLFVYYSISLFLETETHYTASAMSEIIHRQCFYIVMPLCIVLAFVQHLNYFYCIYFKMMNTLRERCKADSAAAAAVCSSTRTENKFKSIGY